MKLCLGEDLDNIYPPVAKRDVVAELPKWEKKLVEARHYYIEKKVLIKYLYEISHKLKAVVKLKQLNKSNVPEIEFSSDEYISNLFWLKHKFIKKAYCIQPAVSIKVVQDVRFFLENNQERVDVLLMDPPHSWCGPNPTRGLANQFGTLSDYEITNQPLGKAVANTLVAVWTITSKKMLF
eukprot:snap_masked-scaffold_3-processed-gene-3.17-mRNA-1 protein AED:1.00 eAED:1.00 QI:0/-1/0/0/-1/1/1/0/179